MKKTLSLVLAVMMILSCMAVPAYAADEIKVVINGNELTMDQPPVLVNDRTLVPVRAIFEGLGATVTWDDSTKTAIGVKDGKEIKITIDQTTAYVDGQAVELDVPAQLISDRTLVPVRFISENLGEKVEWDGNTKTVIITSENGATVKEWTFDNLSSFTHKTDFIMGASYEDKNVSLSTDVDHTTGSGKSLKMANRAKADHRVKLLGAFTPEMVGKTYTISAYVYAPNKGGAISLAAYSDVGTTYAFTPAAYKTVDVAAAAWTKIELVYEHKDAIVTQVGIDQRPASSALIDLIYVDDISITEGGAVSSEPSAGPDEFKSVSVTDGHRPVPTNFTTGKSYDDLIYFGVSDKSNDELLAALPEGKVVVNENVVLDAAAKMSGKEYGSAEIIDVTGQPFTKAVRVDVHTVPQTNPYAIQFDLNEPLAGKATPGDAMLLKVYMRTEKGGANEAQNGQIQMIVEMNQSPHSKSVAGNVINGSQWNVFYFPFKFQESYTRATIRLGYYVQTIDIGGYEIINYGPNVDVMDLPSNAGDDPSLGKDAAWRKEAWDRIEQIRKGDIKVVVKDASGNVIPNAKVDVNMYEHEFQFGSAINSAIYNNEQYKQVVQTNFNAAVPENQTKWVEHEKSPESTIKMLDTLTDLGIKYLRGHVLVWDRDEVDDNGNWEENTSIPQDLVKLYGDRDAMQARIKSHIDEVTSTVKPYFTEWDVLNEACNNKVMQDMYGRELINEWFDMAREALGEDATLYYNDFKTNYELFELLDIMKANNVDFDGIGLQSHYGSITSPETVLDFYDKLYTNYGKRLKITEFDYTTSDFNLQGNFTRDMLIAAFSHEAVDGFIVWGFKGGTGDKYVFYDSDWNEKPGLTAWQDLIYNKWWTEESGVTGADGSFATRGYYGDYDITVTANGVSKTVSVPCYKGSDNTIEIVLE